ncbi:MULTISPECIES: XRE family transcriptional regulator [unclassified Campylobacter]|uniref:XRE family transcriptional regulator n=1 Tax=unclassified Campylobacter TaxID=2593542 RepID=UPI003D345BB7
MDKKEFNELLKSAGLTKKEFAEIMGVLPSSINNWGGSQNVPYWVKSWIENYKFKSRFNEIKEIVNKH